MSRPRRAHGRLDVSLVVIAAALITLIFVLRLLGDVSTDASLFGMFIVVAIASGVRLFLVLRADDGEDGPSKGRGSS